MGAIDSGLDCLGDGASDVIGNRPRRFAAAAPYAHRFEWADGLNERRLESGLNACADNRDSMDDRRGQVTGSNRAGGGGAQVRQVAAIEKIPAGAPVRASNVSTTPSFRPAKPDANLHAYQLPPRR